MNANKIAEESMCDLSDKPATVKFAMSHCTNVCESYTYLKIGSKVERRFSVVDFSLLEVDLA